MKTYTWLQPCKIWACRRLMLLATPYQLGTHIHAQSYLGICELQSAHTCMHAAGWPYCAYASQRQCVTICNHYQPASLIVLSKLMTCLGPCTGLHGTLRQCISAQSRVLCKANMGCDSIVMWPAQCRWRAKQPYVNAAQQKVLSASDNTIEVNECSNLSQCSPH